KMMDFTEQAIGQLNRRDALRAVAGARKRNKQGRDLLAEIQMGRANQVGSSNRLDAAAQLCAEIRRKAFAYECGGARAGENNANRRFLPQWSKKALQRVLTPG